MLPQHKNCPINLFDLLRKLVKANDEVRGRIPEGVAELDGIIDQVLTYILTNNRLSGTPVEKERIIQAAREGNAGEAQLRE